MFNVQIGKDYVVKYARAGKKQDGSTYGVICLQEDMNQPEDIERPSKAKSQVKIWLNDLPAGVKDGGSIVIQGFDGFNWKHNPREAFGKTVYDDVIELIDATVTVVG